MFCPLRHKLLAGLCSLGCYAAGHCCCSSYYSGHHIATMVYFSVLVTAIKQRLVGGLRRRDRREWRLGTVLASTGIGPLQNTVICQGALRAARPSASAA